MDNEDFNELGDELSNEQIKSLQKKIEELMQYRYDDCMDFLNS